ncbi:MAG: hypothetical protein K2X86_01575 [Cytophagaceae bacterium]|nr:hypothetical protein [Cytophagaceae bacterium]
MKTLILVFLLCVAIFTHGQDKIAYIYASDNTNALSFETLLEANGYLVDLVEISNVGTFNFSTYSLIAADHNSGSIGNWGTPADVQQIKNSNKPILALGQGGISLLEQIESGNLGIDWGSSAGSASINGFTAVDPSSTILPALKIFRWI